ncbi:MAG: alkene reductase [Myxococcota bacterium]
MADLFSEGALGRLALSNRVVMAPMTRSRARTDGAPTPEMADYYGQRASAGLIVSEGIYPSEDGKGYCRTPGLVTAEHVAGWKRVVDAVHAQGGRIVAQLMHCGRVGHLDNKQPGTELVSPSGIRARGDMFTDTAGMQPISETRALALDEIPGVLAEYARSTALAYEAGFDGVELHCASGYLPAQFLSTGSNRREDAYGGPVEHRIRFAVEALAAMAGVDGADRVGFRICPGNPFNDLSDEDPVATFRAFLGAVRDEGYAYCHVIRLNSIPNAPDIDNVALANEAWGGPLIVNDSYDLAEAQKTVADGEASAVSFARAYIGNPDLVARFRSGAGLARFDAKRLYSAGPEGYSDYPTLD